MSKGGAQRAAKKREVMERINEAAEKKLLEQTVAEQQAEMERQQRVGAVHMRCRWVILKPMGAYSWPPEVIGSEIAEEMMRVAYEQMLATALAGRERQDGDDPVKPGDIRQVSPLIVPG